MKCEGYGEKLDEKLDCKRDGANWWSIRLFKRQQKEAMSHLLISLLMKISKDWSLRFSLGWKQV
jgi:hypothetical protein